MNLQRSALPSRELFSFLKFSGSSLLRLQLPSSGALPVPVDTFKSLTALTSLTMGRVALTNDVMYALGRSSRLCHRPHVSSLGNSCLLHRLTPRLSQPIDRCPRASKRAHSVL
jgi:hypothetical protein